MARCAGFKPDSTPCERIVKASETYCYAHDPARKNERRRNASRAGRSGGVAEIRSLKGQLEDLAADVLAGEVNRADAAVVCQVLNTRVRLLDLERRVREDDEILARLEELEAVAAGEGAG